MGYGIFLDNVGEGHGKLSLFFQDATEEMCFHFESFVMEHLNRKVLPENIQRQRVFMCGNCGITIPPQLIQQLEERAINQIDCPFCKTPISLLDEEKRLTKKPLSITPEMNYAADFQRAVGANTFVFQAFVKEVKELHMDHTGDNVQVNAHTISNVGGQQNIGKFSNVIANLNASNQAELATALQNLKDAVIASQHLSDEEKQEQVDVISEIGEEASKPKPNKTLLKALGNGLLVTLRTIPDVVKAVTALEPLLSNFHF